MTIEATEKDSEIFWKNNQILQNKTKKSQQQQQDSNMSIGTIKPSVGYTQHI